MEGGTPPYPPLQLTISVYQSALGTTLRGVAKVTRKTVSVASMNLELQRKIAMPLKQYGPEKLLVLPLLRFQWKRLECGIGEKWVKVSFTNSDGCKTIWKMQGQFEINKSFKNETQKLVGIKTSTDFKLVRFKRALCSFLFSIGKYKSENIKFKRMEVSLNKNLSKAFDEQALHCSNWKFASQCQWKGLDTYLCGPVSRGYCMPHTEAKRAFFAVKLGGKVKVCVCPERSHYFPSSPYFCY